MGKLRYFNQAAAYISVKILVKTKTKWITGSGFLYKSVALIEKGEERRLKIFLVSNKHILREDHEKIVFFPNKKLPSGEPDLGNAMPIECIGTTGIITHDEDKVDLACMDVSYVDGMGAYTGSVTDKFLKPIDPNKVGLGSDVLFVGYPDGYYDEKNNLPLVRTGSLASLPDLDFNGERVIAIDAQVFPGSSGSPVFIDWDGSYKILGIISQTVKLEKDDGILGFGIVVKQECLSELLKKAIGLFKERPLPSGFRLIES